MSIDTKLHVLAPWFICLSSGRCWQLETLCVLKKSYMLSDIRLFFRFYVNMFHETLGKKRDSPSSETTWKPLGNTRLPPWFSMVSIRKTRRFQVVSPKLIRLKSAGSKFFWSYIYNYYNYIWQCENLDVKTLIWISENTVNGHN